MTIGASQGSPRRPLSGRRVVVCRLPERGRSLIDGLESLGAEVVNLPLLTPAPAADGGTKLRTQMAALTKDDWLVFTSASALSFAVEAAATWPPAGPVAAIGPATRDAVLQSGAEVAFVPGTATATSLGADLPVTPGQRVLAAVAELAGPELGLALAARGVAFQAVVAYRLETVVCDDPDVLRSAAEADIVLFTSPSTVERYLSLVGPRPELVVTIGPRTSAAVIQAGQTVAAEANPHGVDGLIDAVVNTIGS